jgi:hypothetical protein
MWRWVGQEHGAEIVSDAAGIGPKGKPASECCRSSDEFDDGDAIPMALE